MLGPVIRGSSIVTELPGLMLLAGLARGGRGQHCHMSDPTHGVSVPHAGLGMTRTSSSSPDLIARRRSATRRLCAASAAVLAASPSFTSSRSWYATQARVVRWHSAHGTTQREPMK